MADRIGQQLGNYQLLHKLGEGGFAEVYLGEHIHLGTQAAIKVLHTQLGSDDVDMFRTEARTIAHLIHPHIVRVLEFGVEGRMPFLVMDYASNGTLRNLHPKGSSLAIDTIVTYVKQVAEALQYAHDEKLIHRDIKPENMLVGRRNEILLSDFGIALVAQSSRYQSAQEMAGTMAYMAPEQIQGKPRPASDQYALGIIVYEWLTGDRPFHGSFTELVGQHLSVLPPSLHEKISTISPEVDQVVQIALAKDPKQRFASVQVFATALEQASHLVQSYPPTSSVALPPSQSLQSKIGVPLPSQHSSLTDTVEAIPSPFPRDAPIMLGQSSQSTNVVTPSNSLLQPTVATSPVYTPAVSSLSAGEPIPSGGPQSSEYRISRRAMAVGLVGLTVAGGGFTWLALSQTSRESPPLALGMNLFTHHSLGRVYAVAWSPSGKRIVFGGSEAGVLDAATGTVLFSYHGHSTDGLLAVAWSPDGSRIASAGFDKTVQVWDAATGNHIYTYRGHSSEVFAVAWSPDSKRIASGGGPNSAPTGDTTVQVWDAATGNHIYTYRGHSQIVLAVAWSPNGMRIASAEGDGTGTVQVWDAVDGGYRGHVLVYRGHSIRVDDVAWSPDSTYIASASWDQTVQVCDATTGNRNFTYQSNIQEYAVAWSPDGKRIASGGGSETTSGGGMPVQVWDAFTGKHILTYSGHSCSCYGGVYTVAWSPDGKRIASGGEDQTVQVWQAG